jgi:hypothetical protein
LRYVTAGGIIHSNGFPEDSLDRAMEHDPHFIGVDAGSIDGGPYYLGSGENMHSSRAATKEMYRLLLTRARDAEIPLLLGSAATAGGDVHVDWTVDLFREIAVEEGLAVDLAAIYAEQSRETVRRYDANGAVGPLDESEPLTADVVDRTDRIVAMMGPEPYIEALDRGADVVIAGRSSDVSILTAIAIREGFPEGLATHLAKTLECGALITHARTDEAAQSGYTGSGDCMIGILTDEYFRAKTANPELGVDALEVASHLVYETADPFEVVEPRGVLATGECEYESIDERTVEVRGSRFESADRYTVVLEGARAVGHRATSIVGIRDPGAVEHVEALIEAAERAIAKRARERNASEDYEATFHVYGRDGTMGDREPSPSKAHEVGVFMDIVAPDEDVAHDLLEEAAYSMLASDFPGRKCTAGNAAFPISPTHMNAGTAYEFTIWHRLEPADPLAPFDVTIERVGGTA